MLKSIQQRDLDKNRWVKVTMWVLLILISVSMVITLVPGLVGGSTTNSPDTVASVGGQDISLLEVQRHLNMVLHGQNVPEMLKGLYAKQVLDQMIFSRALDLEAQRLGISVTSQEESERIKQLLPRHLKAGLCQGSICRGSAESHGNVGSGIRIVFTRRHADGEVSPAGYLFRKRQPVRN